MEYRSEYRKYVPSRDFLRFCKSFSSRPSMIFKRRLLKRIDDPFVLKKAKRISSEISISVEDYKTETILEKSAYYSTKKSQ